MPSLFLQFFFVTERSVDGFSVLSQTYVRKDNDAKNPATLGFFIFFTERTENTAQCSIFAVARKIETEWFCWNLPISNDPVVRISRKLVKKNSLKTTWVIYGKKSEFWQRKFIIKQGDLAQITKIVSVILLNSVDRRDFMQVRSRQTMKTIQQLGSFKINKSYLFSLVFNQPRCHGSSTHFCQNAII